MISALELFHQYDQLAVYAAEHVQLVFAVTDHSTRKYIRTEETDYMTIFGSCPFCFPDVRKATKL